MRGGAETKPGFLNVLQDITGAIPAIYTKGWKRGWLLKGRLPTTT
jgi:hypothetical protein